MFLPLLVAIIASLTALATRNFTTRLAGMLMVSPAAGFRPVRAFRSTLTNLPNPGTMNTPFFLTSLTAVVARFSRNCRADLHRRVFSTANNASTELTDSYQNYFTQIFLNDAWLDDDTRSLVYEEEGGRITGFFGAVARQMSFNGQAVRAKVGSQAIVDP